jgi:UDP-glucose 4-epimerase
MKVIVIGGAGFVGSSLCRVLIDAGRDVTVVGRRSPRSFGPPSGCEYRCIDLGDRQAIREILEPGCEVINLAYATAPKASYSDPCSDLLANLPVTVGLLEECLAVGVRRLLLVSSGGTVYGPVQQIPISEAHPTAPISPYGITKLTIEHYAMMFHWISQLPVVLVRPANAYGVHQRAGTGQGFLATAIDAILNRRKVLIFGQTGTIRDYIHVDDVSSGILAALDSGLVGETYNIGTGVGATNMDVIAMLRPLAATCGLEVNVTHAPPRPFDVEANVLDSQKLRALSSWVSKVSLADGLGELWRHALASFPRI